MGLIQPDLPWGHRPTRGLVTGCTTVFCCATRCNERMCTKTPTPSWSTTPLQPCPHDTGTRSLAGCCLWKTGLQETPHREGFSSRARGSKARGEGSQRPWPMVGRGCNILIGEFEQAAFYSQVTLTRATLRSRLTTQPQRSDTRATRGGMMISAGT